MRRILLALFSVSLLASCSLFVPQGKERDDIYANLTVRYLKNTAKDEYEVDSITVPMLVGETISKDSLSKLISSRIGVLQATVADPENKRYTVTGFFEDRKVADSRHEAFSEDTDYKDPGSMPSSDKIIRQYTDLTLVPISEDMTVYAYYERAAEKTYTCTFHCLDFSQSSYGNDNVPKVTDDLVISFEEDDLFTVEGLLRKMSEDESGKSHYKGILGLAHYKACELWKYDASHKISTDSQANDPRARVYDWDRGAIEPNLFLTGTQRVGRPSEDEEQEFFVVYGQDADYPSFCLTFNFIDYIKGVGYESGKVYSAKYNVNVDCEYAKDAASSQYAGIANYLTKSKFYITPFGFDISKEGYKKAKSDLQIEGLNHIGWAGVGRTYSYVAPTLNTDGEFSSVSTSGMLPNALTALSNSADDTLNDESFYSDGSYRDATLYVIYSSTS